VIVLVVFCARGDEFEMRPTCCNHNSPSPTAKRVLEQTGERRVAIRDVGPSLVGQRRDAQAKRGQTAVDFPQLLLHVDVLLSEGAPLFAASQVNEVELRSAYNCARVFLGDLNFNGELKNSVRSGGLLVIFGGTHCPVSTALVQQRKHVIGRRNTILAQALDIQIFLRRAKRREARILMKDEQNEQAKRIG